MRVNLAEREENMEKEIKAFGKTARYLRTETEDENGNWDNSNLTAFDGYAVIHEGNKHHVYALDAVAEVA